MIRAFVYSLVLVFALAVPADAADQFVSVIEDLPLIDGLIENENAAVTFEAAGGRIIEAEARGNIKPFDVVQFYDNVLPQLGWVCRGYWRFLSEKVSVLSSILLKMLMAGRSFVFL